jgi:hypothetical protein
MNKTRVSVGMLVVLVCASAGWSARLQVQTATLYAFAPAEVEATIAVESAAVSLDLPGKLLPDSAQAAQRGAPVAISLIPVYAADSQGPLRSVARYQAQLAGLATGVPAELHFRTSGLSWRPASELAVDGERGQLTIQASITNDAVDLTGARVRLMSGQVGGEPGLLPAYGMASGLDLQAYRLAMEMSRGAANAQAGSGLHLVTELRSVDLPVGGFRQLPLVSQAVKVTRSYRWETGSEGYYGSPVGAQRVAAIYTFTNSSDRPLPEGAVVVSEGRAVEGTGYLEWTPPGETAVAAVAAVQGLSVHRTEETVPRPQLWENRHTVRLAIDNARAETLHVRVIERLSYEMRYQTPSRQRAYEFDQQPDTTQQGTLAWEVAVPAKGSGGVSYSYDEPVDLTALRLLAFTADDSPRERAYLVEAPETNVRQSTKGNYRREIKPGGHAIYRLPVPPGASRVELSAWLGNGFRVSLAPEIDGRPGPYTLEADALAITGRRTGNYAEYRFDLTPFLSKTSRAVYFRLEDPTLTEAKNGAYLRRVQVVRVPEGFASRAPRYAVGE